MLTTTSKTFHAFFDNGQAVALTRIVLPIEPSFKGPENPLLVFRRNPNDIYAANMSALLVFRWN